MPPWAHVTLHTCRAVLGLILWLPDFLSLPGLPLCPLSPSCSVTGLDISRAHPSVHIIRQRRLGSSCDVLFPIHEHGMFSTPLCSLPVTGHFLLHRWSPLAVSSHGGGQGVSLEPSMGHNPHSRRLCPRDQITPKGIRLQHKNIEGQAFLEVHVQTVNYPN